jgi:peptide/nickel transport system ATP-binding protein
MFGLVGESGSGKSTLARVAALLHRPSAGRLVFDGTSVTDPGSIRGTVQMVFQEPRASLNPRWTVQRIIGRPLLTVHHQKASAENIDRLLGDVGLDPRLRSRFPHQLSGGQAQRVAIARALITEPRLLIADEALSGLDVTLQWEVLDLIERLRAERDMAVLFVSHDLRVVARACTTVAVIDRGRIAETLPGKDLLESATSPVTKRLLADMVPSF